MSAADILFGTKTQIITKANGDTDHQIESLKNGRVVNVSHRIRSSMLLNTYAELLAEFIRFMDEVNTSGTMSEPIFEWHNHAGKITAYREWTDRNPL